MAEDPAGPLFSFDSEGRLTLSFREGWREALCCECGDPVQWVLDMASFTSNGRGGFDLGHARCLWKKEAFTQQRKKARRD